MGEAFHYDPDGGWPLYLVTGVAGFIGSALARAVLAQGDKVRGIDNFSTGKRENLIEILDLIDFREADLLDTAALNDACRVWILFFTKPQFLQCLNQYSIQLLAIAPM